jgi:hypothetical protein
VCKFISLSVGVLLQENWRNGTIQNKVTAVQENLLDGFPPFYTATLLGLILILLAGGFRVLMGKHRSVVWYIVVLLVALIVGLVLRARLVWLVVVGVVMRFWVHGVVSRGAVAR